MTVEDNIAFPLREAGERERKVLRSKVSEMLEVMEMEGQEDKMPETLSGGMKKRVGWRAPSFGGPRVYVR